MRTHGNTPVRSERYRRTSVCAIFLDGSILIPAVLQRFRNSPILAVPPEDAAMPPFRGFQADASPWRHTEPRRVWVRLSVPLRERDAANGV